MDNYDLFHSKRFSVGLNMENSQEDILTFLEEYKDMLSSIYFSFPLGRKFYSRTELENEYDLPASEKKLMTILTAMKKCHIRSELTVNTYDLQLSDLDRIAEYAQRNGVCPDEIVCLSEYGPHLRELFPNCELKYSFNNTHMDIPSVFDSVVVGKGFLRNKQARHRIVAQGKDLVVLLNNGCTFECHYPCGDGVFCASLLDNNLQKRDINYLYAAQSFFPFELKKMLDTDEFANTYRFKISNRPLGLNFTKKVLELYASLADVRQLILQDSIAYGYFCVMEQLFIRRENFDYDKIIEQKNKLSC